VDNLGVYRPEEHVDNPRGYPGIEARTYDARLRGPVDPLEVQVDPRTGMKNYIANETGGWSTSSAYIRTSLIKAIELGRRAVTEVERHEALRLLGQVGDPLLAWLQWLTIFRLFIHSKIFVLIQTGLN
jgi:Heterokaryon incompatibility protein Het-C